MCPNSSQHLQSADFGQLQIKKYHGGNNIARLPCLDKVDRLLSVACHRERVGQLVSDKGALGKVYIHRIIFDEQNWQGMTHTNPGSAWGTVSPAWLDKGSWRKKTAPSPS